MKKKITAVSLLVLEVALVALGTAAFFTAQRRATNVITTGAISMSITEDGEFNFNQNSETYVLPDTLMPSERADMVIAVQNDGPEPFYTRVRADIEIRDSNNQPMADRFDQYVGLNLRSTDPNGSENASGGDNWQTKLVDGQSDGWYYYKQSLPQTNGETTPIYITILLKPETPNEMMGAKVSVTVTAQAVQSKNNPVPAQGITHVEGWPAEG